MDSNTTDGLQQGAVFQQDHVSLHKAHQTTQKTAQMDWEVLTHLLYSPDLAPSDFHLFGPLKESLRGGIKFENNDAVQQHVLKFLVVLSKIYMPQASRDLLSAGNTALNCTETMLRNNIIAVFAFIIV